MTDTATETTGRIVWFELPATDSARAKQFYGRLFGWSFQPFGDMDYHVTEDGDGGITGLADGPGLLAYFGVEDIEAAAGQVRELGGEAGETQEIPGVGRYAVCRDTEGNTFGLYQRVGS